MSECQQTAFITKSMSDPTPRYPKRVHLVEDAYDCYCGAKIGGPMWFISYDNKQGVQATCQECIRKNRKQRGAER